MAVQLAQQDFFLSAYSIIEYTLIEAVQVSDEFHLNSFIISTVSTYIIYEKLMRFNVSNKKASTKKCLIMHILLFFSFSNSILPF